MIYQRNFNQWIVYLLIVGITIASCKKSDSDQANGNLLEKPGQIPGMGEHSGTLSGTQFMLPKGTSLKGAIVGSADPSGGCVVDGNGESVTVRLTIQRDSIGGTPLTVEFPPGLIITSTSEFYQHGLLVERVLVPLPPKQSGSDVITCEVSLLLQCINKERSPSDIFASYKFGPVTNSPLIVDLIKKLSTKKTTYKDYNGDGDKWRTCSEGLRSIIWHLTDGDGLTDDDLDFIKSLPSK